MASPFTIATVTLTGGTTWDEFAIPTGTFEMFIQLRDDGADVQVGLTDPTVAGLRWTIKSTQEESAVPLHIKRRGMGGTSIYFLGTGSHVVEILYLRDETA